MALGRLALAALAAGLFAWTASAARADTLAASNAAEDGDAAFNAGLYQVARDLWTVAAGAGDAQSAFNLGLLYDLGDGVPPDASIAFHWYRIAAEAGLSAAALNVGVMFDSGRGVAVDRAQAALWYARAASLGQREAAFNLGQLYETGEGVPQNTSAAIAWYRAAAVAIPEAAVKASALAAQRSALGQGQLLAPIPVWPAAGASVPLAGPHPAAQLVWTAPAEPRPVTYFVELEAQENGQYNELFARYVATSAVAVALPDDKVFAWRVYAVAADGSGYAPSAWIRFGKADAEQAVAAGSPALPVSAVTQTPGNLPRAAHP